MTQTVIFNRVYNSFIRNGVTKALGFQLIKAEKGLCEINLPYSEKVTQQQGGFHGGMVGTLADMAAGFAGLSVAPDNMEVVSVEYKINFLYTGKGGHLNAVGKVIKAGKRLIITSADVFHISPEGKSTLSAVIQQTIVPVEKKY